MPPAATTNETWTWQPAGSAVATTLNFPYWNITTFGGTRFALPALRGQNYEVPFRQGQVQRPKYPDQRVITLAMWTAGIDQTSGAPAADQMLAFNNNFAQLRSLFWNPGLLGSQQGQLTRNWWRGSGALLTGTALAEIAGTMQPTMTGRTRADFSVDFLLADPFFYGTQVTSTIAYNTPTNVSNPGDDFVGFGYAQPFTIKLNGPLQSPVLTNSTWGVQFNYTQTIASSASVTLDVLNFTALDNSGNSQLGFVTHSGARPWMVLGPANIATNNVLTLTSSNGADTGTAVLTWSPPYL